MTATTAAEIVFDHVTKRYAGRDAAAVDDLSLEIPAGDVLRARRPVRRRQDDGAEDGQPPDPVRLGRDPDRRTQHQRAAARPSCGAGIGYVIQQIGLFPHMTIGENIATVPRLLGWPKAKIRDAHDRAARARRARGRRRERAIRRSSRAASASASASRARSRPTRRSS